MSVGRLQRYANAFNNVIASGVASNSIVPGRTLENIQLKLGGGAFTKAMVTDIKVKADGARVIFNLSGSQLDKINAFRGETVEANFLDIPFADIRGLTEADRMVGAFDTAALNTLTEEITIAGATTPTLAATLLESPSQSAGGAGPVSGFVSKFLRYPWSVATGGELPVQLPFGPNGGSRVKRIHIEQTNNLCTGVTVKQDGLVVHQSLKAENDHWLKRWGCVPQANWYSIDFVPDGNFQKWLDTRDARTLELLPNLSGADNGFIIVEYVDRLENL